ncbi:helix-turn-helix transcriptional regulator [Escherichia coli]|uniref:helix-turn-helix transcriptional regulator n=1 Tax=Escherichia coli TaxID=562 RepID=UPI00384E3991
MLTTTSHDSVLLRADDPLIDMNYITSFTGMTDKWFYRLISEGHFPKPIKLGRSSMKRVAMPALVLRKSALSPMLATLPLIFLLTPLVSQLVVIIS